MLIGHRNLPSTVKVTYYLLQYLYAASTKVSRCPRHIIQCVPPREALVACGRTDVILEVEGCYRIRNDQAAVWHAIGAVPGVTPLAVGKELASATPSCQYLHS